jgi:hypothetical protein
MFGLHWVRARQRDLTKVVLALFCLAWLQAAAVPCVMAGVLQPAAAAAAHHDCQYCPPPSTAPAGAGHQDTCLYPHGPQVDARAAAGPFFVMPVATVIATLAAQPVETDALVDRADPGVPATPLSVSYCRFLE